MPSQRAQAGQAIVLIALMMAALIGFVALALDSARAFDGRRIMQTAVDAGALAAAEYYQNNPGSWTGAEAQAATYFGRDNRLYTGYSCNPGSVSPTPGAPGTPVSMTCSYGASSYQVTIAAEDDGPAGQTFTLSGQRSLELALMQVVGDSPDITVRATSAATASDQALSPALAGLSGSGCGGVTGTVPLSITSSTSPLYIVGDVVADGTFNIGSLSFPKIAGNVLTRCAPPSNSSNISYYCWPGGSASPCSGGSVQGRTLSTTYRFVDPSYAAPTMPNNTITFDSTKVVLSPGIYTADPNFGSSTATCYFLSGGIYNWQGGMTVSQGIVSNELKPPDEPSTSSSTTRATHQFWDDNGASCSGGFSLSSGSSGGHGISNGTWSVVVTALRTTTYNSVSYLRESAPSMCRTIAISGPDKTLAVSVNNVPGADHYNVYAQPPGGTACAGPFGLVTPNSVTNSSIETQPSSGGSLGTASGGWDNTTLTAGWTPSSTASADTAEAYPPDSETAAWSSGANSSAECSSVPCLPNQNAARGSTATAGDRANENHCASPTSTAGVICPNGFASGDVTPGAVVMYATNGGCFNVKNSLPGSTSGVGGDAYLFSGYQYDWLLNYEPASTTSCTNTASHTNTWYGVVNTASIGMTYTPGAAFNSQGFAAFSSDIGGIVAKSILIQGASNETIAYSRNFSPAPGGTRLTG